MHGDGTGPSISTHTHTRSPRIEKIWFLCSKATASAGKCLKAALAALEVQRQLVWIDTAEVMVIASGSSSVGLYYAAGLHGVRSEPRGAIHISGLRLHQPQGGGGGS